MIINNEEYMQTPTAKLIDTGNNSCVLILENWNVQEVIDGYHEEEVKSLIDMLEHSLDLMTRYNRMNEKLPLFEQEDDVNAKSKPSVQRSV